jgi:type I restriction enzyme M protein
LEDEILDIPSYQDLKNEKRIKDLLTQTKAFTRDEFSNLLFR